MENKRLIDEIIDETKSILYMLKQCDEHEQPTTKEYYLKVLKLCELIKKKENKMKKQKHYKISWKNVENCGKYGKLVYEWISDKMKNYEKSLKKGK